MAKRTSLLDTAEDQIHSKPCLIRPSDPLARCEARPEGRERINNGIETSSELSNTRALRQQDGVGNLKISSWQRTRASRALIQPTVRIFFHKLLAIALGQGHLSALRGHSRHTNVNGTGRRLDSKDRRMIRGSIWYSVANRRRALLALERRRLPCIYPLRGSLYLFCSTRVS